MGVQVVVEGAVEYFTAADFLIEDGVLLIHEVRIPGRKLIAKKAYAPGVWLTVEVKLEEE